MHSVCKDSSLQGVQLCLKEATLCGIPSWGQACSLRPVQRMTDSLLSGLKLLKSLEDCQTLSSKHPLLPEGWKKYLQRVEQQNARELTYLFLQILADSAA